MKKFIKVCFWIGGISFLLGAVFLLAGWALGFKGFHLGNDYDKNIQEVNQVIREPVRKLKLNMAAGTVEIRTGKDFSIQSVSEDLEYESSVKDGVWTVERRQTDRIGINLDGVKVEDEGVYLLPGEGYLCITVPEDAVLDGIDLEIEAGTLEADALSCRDFSLEIKAGTAQIRQLTAEGCSAEVTGGQLKLETSAKDMKLDVTAGDLYAVVAGKEESYRTEMECETGSVIIGEESFSGQTRHYVRNKDGQNSLQVTCRAGKAEIRFKSAF